MNISIRAMLSVTFILALFASQSALASQLTFNLNTADNSLVGQGTLVEVSDFSVQIAISLDGKEYTGAGAITKNSGLSTLKLQRQGLRADRALFKLLSMRHKKHIQTLMIAKDDAKLDCALNVFGSQISGQCINLSNEQTLSVKSLTGESL
jgi:hypothetical protein